MSIVIFEPFEVDRKEVAKILVEANYDDFVFCEAINQLEITLGLDKPPSMAKPEVDLIIVDMERGGLEMVRKIKNSTLFFDVPLIVLSTTSQQETLQMAFAFGATDFISKPLMHYEFTARIRSALKIKHESDRRQAREKELLETTMQLQDLTTFLNRLSLLDGLTGISNRRSFDMSMDKALRTAKRRRESLTLILIDIDYFKKYNDTYGHINGDECLKTVVQYLRGVLHRPGDVLARYGGEEFGIILPETDKAGATFVAEKIKEAIALMKKPHESSDVSDYVTLSLGICSVSPGLELEPADIIKMADHALYQTKNRGRNGFTFFDSEDTLIEEPDRTG